MYRCWSIDTYPPYPGLNENVPSSKNYEGGFQAALMLKDLGIANEAANQVGARTEVGEHVKKIYEDICKKGYSNKDFSYVFQYIDKKL